MKNVCKKVLVVLMAAIMLVTMLPSSEAMAATTKFAYLNKESVTVTVGETFQLKMMDSKAKVTWSSSNKKIATVSNTGKVKGIKAGSVTITAKISNMSYKAKVKVVKAVTTKLMCQANGDLKVGFILTTPDGSKVKTKQIGDKTVAIMPRGTKFTVDKESTSENHGSLTYFVNQVASKDEVLAYMEDESLDLAVKGGVDIEQAFEKSEVVGRYINGENKFGEKLNFNKLGEYEYFDIIIHDSDWMVDGIAHFYFIYK